MDTRITTFFVLCCELLNALNIRDNSQAEMSGAEAMTVVLTAAAFFGGNFRRAAAFLEEYGYIPDMLSEGRLNRRIHALDDDVRHNLFPVLSRCFIERNREKEYIIDSFPVPVCDNIRIGRAKIFQGEEFRGVIPCKRRYFYGLRVHMIVTASGEPVEFLLAPGAGSDVSVLKHLQFPLPSGSTCYGDKIYNDYIFEDLLSEAADITMKPIRKKNSLRAEGDFIFRRGTACTRKRIETAFSCINNFLPKKIHAVTPQGFALKVISFIIVFSIQRL